MLTKNVNGVDVECSAQEEAEIRAEWDANAPKPLSISDLAAATITKVRAMRTNVFATLAGIQSQALANSDMATAKAISGLQDSLKALPDIDLSGCQSQADIDSAFTAAWGAIVQAAPANVKSAFNGLITL